MGHWRSWLARFHGMEEVIGSNPICSTKIRTYREVGFYFGLRYTSAMSTGSAIVANGLTVKKLKKEILRDVSFELAEGKLVGLIGPSGSGKTTLMRTLIGMQKTSSGAAQLLGKDAGAKELRQQIGYRSQDPAAYSDLTVEQNLRYFAALTRADRRQIDKVLEQVDLTPQRKQLVSTLSGGQMARVSLAIALLGSPSVLVLDEPTIGLDPVLRVQLWKLFHKLRDEGRTIIVSSHVMDEAERCDDLLLLRDGGLLWHGPAEELKKTTKTDTVEAAFLKLVGKGSA
jgi:ABC-2 type transport system ATP-binding protein